MSTPARAPIALALVGVGKIARDRHLPAIAAEPAFRLVAKASRDRAQQSDVEYDSLDALLAAVPEVAAISLASPPQGRGELARAALLAGKHVMLEKPPCATLSEARELEALARAKSLTLFAAWHSREAAAVPAARDWLAGKRIVSAAIRWREDVRVWHPGQEWIFEAGGMGVFDPAINALSILTDILSGCVYVKAAELAIPRNRQAPIRAALQMLHDFETPITGEFDFLYQGDPQWTIVIETNAGSLQLDNGGAELAIDGVRTVSGENQEYPRLYRKFAALIAYRAVEFDLRPFELVADAMLVGGRTIADPFHF